MSLKLNARSIAAVVALVAMLATTLVVVAGAGATVPPKNCGTMVVKGRTYQVKADQIRCRTARDYARRYLSSADAPSGWRCRSFTSSKMKFRCTRGIRVVFAIKR